MNAASRPEAAHDQRANKVTQEVGGYVPPTSPFSIEPSETLELPASPSVKRRLCGVNDGSLEERRDETAARARALGIAVPLYEKFPCILAGHDHAAKLHPTSAGFWQYRCTGLGRAVGLAEVRAFLAYGAERHISGVEAARWRERLDYEAHIRFPVPLTVDLPDPCPRAARDVAGWMRIFVGLRDPRFPLHEPFPFAYDFGRAYGGRSGDQLRSGKDFLERANVIHRAGLTGRTILWKLTAQPATPQSEHPGGRRDA